MTWKTTVPLVASAILLASPLAAQPAVPAAMTVGHQPVPRHTGVGWNKAWPLLVPVQARDSRTARERCLDEETAKVGGTPTPLDRATIDLKCSQR